MITIAAWLDAQAEGVPPHLMQAVRAAVGADGLAAPVDEAPERFVAAADRQVEALLAQDRTGRDSALALLAADALVTFAFEAAAEDPGRLPERADAAARTLATLRTAAGSAG